jgi:elongation factor G
MPGKDPIRNISVIGYDGAGKTAFTEALSRLGAPDRASKDGSTSRLDHEPEEGKRNFSVTTHVTHLQWKGNTINVLDTPGFSNFLTETANMVSMTEAAVMVCSATGAAKHLTERFWFIAEDAKLPVAFYVNRMDTEGANLEKAVKEIEAEIQARVVVCQLPIGTDTLHRGVVDLFTGKAWITEGAFGKMGEKEIPADTKDEAAVYRTKFIESVAECDDDLLNKYLEGTEPTPAELEAAFAKGFATRKIFPLFCGSAKKGTGLGLLLDCVAQSFPAPNERAEWVGSDPKGGQALMRKPLASEPLSALVFKTTIDRFTGNVSFLRVVSGTLTADTAVYNPAKRVEEKFAGLVKVDGKNLVPVKQAAAGDVVALTKLKETQTGDTLCDSGSPVLLAPFAAPKRVMSVAVKPKNKADEDKMAQGILKLVEEDPVLEYSRDPVIKEAILAGMGQAHIEVTIERLRRKFEVEVSSSPPRIAYRETVKGKSEAQGKYKKQTGGRGQYGDCWLKMEPLARGAGFEFADEIFGGAIPKNFIPAVQKGVEGAMLEGPVAGYPVVDVKVTVYDGSYHDVDSSELAFKMAGSFGFQNCIAEANPVLLEPIMKIEVTIPEEYMGDVIGDLNSRRGKILGMESTRRGSTIKALVPQAEILTYSPELHSRTQGLGYYTMEFSHYEEAPPLVAAKVKEQAAKAKAAEDAARK